MIEQNRMQNLKVDAIMINKYKELHDKFLSELVEYHNLQLTLTDKKMYHTLLDLSKIVMKMGATLKAMKLENFAVRKEIQTKRRIRLAALAEAKKLKKENENDTTNK